MMKVMVRSLCLSNKGSVRWLGDLDICEFIGNCFDHKDPGHSNWQIKTMLNFFLSLVLEQAPLTDPLLSFRPLSFFTLSSSDLHLSRQTSLHFQLISLVHIIFFWNIPLAFSTLPSRAELLVLPLLILALALLPCCRRSWSDSCCTCEKIRSRLRCLWKETCHLEGGVAVVGLDESCNNPILHCWKSDMPGIISECLVNLVVLKSAWLP